MRTRLFLLSVVLTVSACDTVEKLYSAGADKQPATPIHEAAPVPKDDWMEFSSETAGFKTRFPAAPEHKKLSAPTALGDVATEMFSCEIEGGAFLAVSVSTMPAALKESEFDMEAGLDGARNGAINNVQGTLLKEKSIKWLGFDAREFEAKTTRDGGEMRLVARIVLKWPKLYQLMIVYPTAAPVPPIQRFFAEFELTP
ncbi:MAG: hypothetical protein JKY37_12660 [Nannocystaceae bacterium]|nr:hypothetical protein [Nannocystaceae bacterium]